MVKIVIRCLSSNLNYLIDLCPLRSDLFGAPHTYLVTVRCAQDQPALARPGETQTLLAWCERLRQGFDARMFAFRIDRAAMTLVLRHREVADSDERLRERWRSLDGSTSALPRLRTRFTHLGGFMQTLLQRYSRDWNRRNQGSGHLWASRYRACLLADDAALLAAVVWVEDESLHERPALASSRGQHDGTSAMVLSGLPLRLGPGDSLFTTDESPPGLAPPPESDNQRWLERFAFHLSAIDRRAYGRALACGWALGRPDSLSETIARLGRSSGRGRSRQLRDLDDQLGLCGVWG